MSPNIRDLFVVLFLGGGGKGGHEGTEGHEKSVANIIQLRLLSAKSSSRDQR